MSTPTRAQTSGQGIHSTRELMASALVRCVLCTVDGPKHLVAEHLAADHTNPRKTSGFNVSIAPHLRAPLVELSRRSGVTLGALISAAVDQHLTRLVR